MNAVLSRLVPGGLAARFALLLAAALLAANLVALALLSFERDRLGREARDDREIERIVGLVPALEAIEPVFRQPVARDASTRVARIDVGAEPIVERTRPDVRSRALFARLRASLGAREVRVAILPRDVARGQPADGPGRDGRRSHRGGREVIAISIALSGAAVNASTGVVADTWLNVTTRGENRPSNGVEGEVFLLLLALSLVAVLGVGLLFVRHLTRPLSRLAEAARAAGRGDRSVRVPERGAHEMREAAAAFNAMQGRIARFDAERTRTVAAVGHDLRTPITSLRIRAEMLERDVREPMVRTLEEMAVMADGLVAWARGQGDSEERRTIDLAGLLRGLCEERGASVEAADDVVVRGRPVGLSRAIGNLVDNAIRYGGTARVRSSADGENATITIEDDGPGIPSAQLDDLFEPFVRGEASRNAATGGAGLGLSIARSIVQAHGGRIELSNLDGGGLSAVVVLPLPD